MNEYELPPEVCNIYLAWEECKEPNWDGYDAFPVCRETVDNACALIKSLPPEISMPSVGAEPDGHLTLEWYRSPRRVLSVSVSPEGALYYAALFGSSEVSGSGRSDEIVISLIRRVYE